MLRVLRCVSVVALASCGKSSSSSDVAAEQAKAFRSGWSAQPASPGTLFGGLVPGGPDEMTTLYQKLHAGFSTEHVWDPKGERPTLMAMFGDSRVVIHVESRDGKISDLGLWTNDKRDVGCPADLAPSIRTAWQSAPHATADKLEIWLDPVHQWRATLETGDQCRLEFERYEPEDTWLENVGHIGLVGSPATQIAQTVGVRAHIDQDGRASWTDRGCGFGGGITGIEAQIEKDRIVSITAGTYVADVTFQAVLAKLVAARGQPSEVTGLTMRRLEWWTTGTPLRVDYDHGQLHVSSGAFAAR